MLGPILIALLAACTVFGLAAPQFAQPENMALIAQQVMVLGVIAIGQTLIILTAGIDLSCGVVMALGGTVISRLAVLHHWPAVLALACGLCLTTACGLLNGWLVSGLRLPPFIVTLGSYNIAFALNQLLSRGQTITDLPPLLTALGGGLTLAGSRIPWGVWLLLGLYGLGSLWLQHTAPGRHVLAVGGQAEAARLAGIPVRRVVVQVYGLAGLLYGVAALLALARTGVGDPNAGQSENLDAITAVVLGGTSLFGGRGSLLGTLVGTLVVGVLRNGLTLIGLDSVVQQLVTGVLVIAAVAADRRRGSRP